MTCENKHDLLPIRLETWNRPVEPPVIAWLNRARRLLIIPVTWRKNYFWDCLSWTVDRETWTRARPSFDIVHVHLRHFDGHVIYTIAARQFELLGHSSYGCYEGAEKYPEKWHCAEDHFRYDKALRDRYPPSERPVQPTLL